MSSFKDDLRKWEEAEEVVISILNSNGYNVMKNPDKKGIDLIILENGIEVKSDFYAHKSGNVYIEYECHWKPSWIYKDEKIKMKYWVHTALQRVYMMEGEMFKEWITEKISDCRNNKSLTSKGFRICENWWDWWRSRGLLVPVKELEKIAHVIYNAE